ncbi:helix-turn-helix domain-containing protein [Ornithinibacillus sp. L9]|uniref:Helix-turn-helix domain-containing protein n=1 Tax=Ornithinibacillus caprae TaxID=2678566 RepID=A0A6N8FM92_9BACI|nr:helix-turn-helix transcriptional regulator [Ornithinibacillus caprae]MUK89117.1 helix-turn-helix domain-containing protein [Ornithinibacillus caprae]
MKNQRLIEARKQKHLNQTQLAQMLGFKGKQSVANWENGHSTPTLSTAIEISKILEKDVVYLFGHKVQVSQTKTKQEVV